MYKSYVNSLNIDLIQLWEWARSHLMEMFGIHGYKVMHLYRFNLVTVV